jgi:putative membrane protein
LSQISGRAVPCSIRNAPNAKQKEDYDKMSKLSGAAFDKAFAQRMVADHTKDISAFQKESKSKNQTVASFASETLPTLQKHLQTAQSLHKGGRSAKQ